MKHANPPVANDLTHRLRTVHGHLVSIAAMYDAQRPATEIAQQLGPVRQALRTITTLLIKEELHRVLDDLTLTPDDQAEPVTALLHQQRAT